MTQATDRQNWRGDLGRGCVALWVLTALIAVAGPGLAQGSQASSALWQEGKESLRIRVVNKTGGPIEVSADGGHSWERLGSVVRPANAVNPRGYTASKWAQDSAIAATAVNAIHIKVRNDPATGRAIIFSLAPRGNTIGATVDKPSSDIFTDLPGGAGIFGGGLGPYVNSKVYLANSEPPVPLPPDYVPAVGDRLLIIRRDPARLPQYATLENRVGGAITLQYTDGQVVTLGAVDRPVFGVGRFGGEVYAAPGRIRANHPGVIDISTSPIGLVGGFQIIPHIHALSPEMYYVKTNTQWMVVGPTQAGVPYWAGKPPLFASFILPSFRQDDILGGHEDWMERTLSRTQVLARYGDGPWGLMPRIAFSAHTCPRNSREATDAGRHGLWLIAANLDENQPLSPRVIAVANHALDGISAFRIVFPLDDFWPDNWPRE